MASTTLITFMLQTPTTVFSVEILGSWDNFSKPYQLKKDRRIGPGQWRGCHTFENITCDGDIRNASLSREGALKMGGTYWYYYILDGDTDYHDPAVPSTSLCPLLPGQVVNVLDVPVHENVLFGGSRKLSSGSMESVVFTLDPQDKYLPGGVRRASTTSAVHARKAGLPAATRALVQAQRDGSTDAESVLLQRSKRTHHASVPQRQHSLLSVFHQMRQTRSAGSNAMSKLAWPRKLFSRAGKSTKQGTPDPDPGSAKQLGRAVSTSPTKIWDGSELPNCLPCTAETEYRAPTALLINLANPDDNTHPSQQLSCSEYSQLTPSNERDQGLNEGDLMMAARDSGVSFWSSYYAPTEQLGDTLSHCASVAAEKRNVMALSDHLGRLDFAPDVSKPTKDPTKMPFDNQTNSLNAIHLTDLPETFEPDSNSPKNGYPDSLASYAASANFSPCLGSNTTQSGVISPCHLSQPETPVMSDYGEDLPPFLQDSESLAQMGRSSSSELDLPLTGPFSSARPANLPRPQQEDDMQTSHASWGGFQGYSLPDHDHASVNTIRKIPSFTLKSTDGASPFAPPNSKQELVHSWNDVSENHMTALGELVEDLGYLGKLII